MLPEKATKSDCVVKTSIAIHGSPRHMPRVTLRTIFKVDTVLRTDFRGKDSRSTRSVLLYSLSLSKVLSYKVNFSVVQTFLYQY